ncbi:hypothetical protein B0T24DRAFT_136132 [Lasiosphaeria ovina]|uniref:Uncharacterized protein n=1 Tax=Lasiosphaeria ovina TaxID=92902 RepID=A0AAE0KL53_9PEZI|nr:hypothetical protein B0T24DRAFT_136132 [Lasiosphaeria ovina]
MMHPFISALPLFGSCLPPITFAFQDQWRLELKMRATSTDNPLRNHRQDPKRGEAFMQAQSNKCLLLGFPSRVASANRARTSTAFRRSALRICRPGRCGLAPARPLWPPPHPSHLPRSVPLHEAAGPANRPPPPCEPKNVSDNFSSLRAGAHCAGSWVGPLAHASQPATGILFIRCVCLV